MTTIKYKKSELKKLIGKKMSNSQLEETITLVKPNFEEEDKETITIEHTADRPDLFGVEGLARSISSYIGIRKGLRKYTVFKPKISVKMNSIPIRPYVSAAIVRNVKMTPDFFESMIKMQEVLNESIGRKRKKAAIGIHDLDRIEGSLSYVGVSRKESMVPLESSEEMTLSEVLEKNEKGMDYGEIIKSVNLWPVFKDKKGIISFPPIINSDRTKVTEKTKNFFIEVTGTDKKTVSQTINILVTNFSERKFSLEGVRLKYEKRSEVTPNLLESVSEIDLETVNKKLGLDLSVPDVIKLLERMGYDAFGSSEKIEVIIPSYRNDILHPMDIVEDIAIAYGYNNFKPEIPNISTIGSSTELQKLSQRASMALVGLGFQEVMKSCLSNKKDQFEKMNIPESKIIEIENPTSSEYSCVRYSLLPGLMKMLSANKHYEYPQNIFEVGDVVIPDKTEETSARNERRIAGIVCHSKAGFIEMKHVIESLMKSIGLGYSARLCDSTMYIPGRAIDMYIDKKYMGSFGELHPQTIENWDLGMPATAFEIILEKL